MSKNIIFILLFILNNNCAVQKETSNYGIQNNGTEIIKLNKSIGVIFPKDFDITYFDYQRVSEKFTPTKEEILKMELEIEKQYLQSEMEWAKGLNASEKKNDQEYLTDLKFVRKEAKQIKYFDRQYFGFIENNEKIILIEFLDFREDPYNLKKEIHKEFIFGAHGWFYSNVRFSEYNIAKNKLSTW